MPPAHRGPTGAPIDRWTAASPTAIASGFTAAMALGPQPKFITPPQFTNNATLATPQLSADSIGDLMSGDDDEDDDDNDNNEDGNDAPAAANNATINNDSGNGEGSGNSDALGIGASSSNSNSNGNGDGSSNNNNSNSTGNSNTVTANTTASTTAAANTFNSTAKAKAKAKSTSTAAAGAAKKGAARSRDSAALQHRKEQNRAAQREFRQRKQQYIRALEARVELLSSDHDTQVDRLRFALRQLLAENNTLRTIVASLASFIGNGNIGGCMAEAGLSRSELEDAMNSRSEKTMTEAWQNWPGAKECETLKQIRLESNIPVDGLPENQLPPKATTTANSSDPASRPPATQAAGYKNGTGGDQTQAEGSGTAANAANANAGDGNGNGTATGESKKRKKSASANELATAATRRKSSGQATTTAAKPIEGAPHAYSTVANAQSQRAATQAAEQPAQRSVVQRQPQQQQQPTLVTASPASSMAPPGGRDSPAMDPTVAASSSSGSTPQFSVFSLAPAGASQPISGFVTPEMWQQQQQMNNLYMLQQQPPLNSVDATFLQTLFGDAGTPSGTFGQVPNTPGFPLDFGTPHPVMSSTPTMAGIDLGNDRTEAGSMPLSAAMAVSTSGAGSSTSGSHANGSTPANASSASTSGPTLASQRRESIASLQQSQSQPHTQPRSQQTPLAALHQERRPSTPQQSAETLRPFTSMDMANMQRRIVRLVTALNRVLRARGIKEFVDLPPDCELTQEDLRYVEEQERTKAYLILAHHGFEGDLQDELEMRTAEGDVVHQVLTRQQIEQAETSYLQLLYHFRNYQLNPKYRLPPLLQPTALQLSQPHSPDIDSIPWPSMRDALILNSQLDFEEVTFEMFRAAEIHDGDILFEELWEIHRPFLVRFPMLADDRILEISNRWRKQRGQPPLTREGLWKDHEQLKLAQKRRWKELGEPFPLPS
ncbi:hypothetical protein ACQY0O_007666 [Thecaphora frezii]